MIVTNTARLQNYESGGSMFAVTSKLCFVSPSFHPKPLSALPTDTSHLLCHGTRVPYCRIKVRSLADSVHFLGFNFLLIIPMKRYFYPVLRESCWLEKQCTYSQCCFNRLLLVKWVNPVRCVLYVSKYMFSACNS